MYAVLYSEFIDVFFSVSDMKWKRLGVLCSLLIIILLVFLLGDSTQMTNLQVGNDAYLRRLKKEDEGRTVTVSVNNNQHIPDKVVNSGPAAPDNPPDVLIIPKARYPDPEVIRGGEKEHKEGKKEEPKPIIVEEPTPKLVDRDVKDLPKPMLKKTKTPATPKKATDLYTFGQKQVCYDEVKDVISAAKKWASADRVLTLVTVVDTANLAMAINMYITSFLAHKITNAVMVCTDRQAYNSLRHRCIPAVLYRELKGRPPHGFVFMSTGFIKLATLKFQLVYDVVNAGYSVLLVEPDVLFIKNPFPTLALQNPSTPDLQLMIGQQTTEKVILSSGLMAVRASRLSKSLFNQMAKRANDSDVFDEDEVLLNYILDQRRNANASIPTIIIHQSKFASGELYFDKPKRYFFDSTPKLPPSLLILHNSHIVGVSAKMYRLREHLLWKSDVGLYYSDPHRKYLLYHNPFDLHEKTPEAEKEALISALAIASILNRTVILPRFHCQCTSTGCEFECPLHYLFHVARFDDKFENKFRENSFLHNVETPTDLKQANNSKPVIIKSDKIASLLENDNTQIDFDQQFTPANSTGGATSTEIKEWFSSYKNKRLIKFYCMYNAFSKFTDESEDTDFTNKVKSGLQRSESQQRGVL